MMKFGLTGKGESMKKFALMATVLFVLISSFSACGSPQKNTATPEVEKPEVAGTGPITWVWYPNESGEDTRTAREEISRIIETATGRKVEHKLTTDYIIAIESIASDNAHLGFFGAEGYIQANKKNSKVIPLSVNSGPSSTLSDAIYHSWLNVQKGKENDYKTNGVYSIDNIQGKKFSFVSNSSTSGFRVPSSSIVAYFSKMEQWKDLEVDDLLEGGANNFFKEVLYGGSHQGSAVNLLTGKSDISAFCDSCVYNYIELAEGPENTPGSVYRIRADAADPFEALRGQEFVIISVTPVLNAPFVVNKNLLTTEEINKIKTALFSEETAQNEKIFIKKGSEHKGFFKAGERFVAVEDSWFDPIRKLSK
jgi:phosphonate transport system substrate-binding protein